MLDAIKYITDNNFFFQEDITQVHIVCNTIQLSENVIFAFPRFARLRRSKLLEMVKWYIVKRLLIASLSGSAKIISESMHHACVSKL